MGALLPRNSVQSRAKQVAGWEVLQETRCGSCTVADNSSAAFDSRCKLTLAKRSV